MTRTRIFAALACAALLSACDAYEKNAVQDITGPAPTARIKFFHFGINAPGVYFYADNAKMTAVGTTLCSPPPVPANPACTANGLEPVTGSAYGATVAGGYYMAIAPGQHTVTGRIAAATDNNLAIATLPVSIADGKYYSFYMTGFYDAATKKADAFMIEDDIPTALDYAVAQIRFVNASPNSSPMTLYAKNTTTGEEKALGALVAYKAGGAFVTLPEGTYDLSTRTAGSSTNAILRTAVGFSGGHVYTITARGDMTVTSTTATNRPFLDNTTNF